MWLVRTKRNRRRYTPVNMGSQISRGQTSECVDSVGLPLPMNLRAENSAPQTRRYLLSAFALTFAFGIAMIANSQAAAEGTWFWYAVLFRHGERLYSQLQLALQPLFVIETAGFMAVLGEGWLASKVPAVLHVAALSLAF